MLKVRNQSRVEIRNMLISSTHNRKDLVIIDAGCGDMQYKELSASNKYIGVDFCKVNKYYPYNDLIVADLANMPLSDSTGDIIWCVQVLEHVSNPLSVLIELYRVAKQGARLYLTVPFIYKEHEMPYDFYRYTRVGVSSLLDQSGWKILTMEPLENALTTIAHIVSTAGKVIPTHTSNRLQNYIFTCIRFFLISIAMLIARLGLTNGVAINSPVVKNWKIVAEKES